MTPIVVSITSNIGTVFEEKSVQTSNIFLSIANIFWSKRVAQNLIIVLAIIASLINKQQAILSHLSSTNENFKRSSCWQKYLNHRLHVSNQRSIIADTKEIRSQWRTRYIPESNEEEIRHYRILLSYLISSVRTAAAYRSGINFSNETTWTAEASSDAYVWTPRRSWFARVRGKFRPRD